MARRQGKEKKNRLFKAAAAEVPSGRDVPAQEPAEESVRIYEPHHTEEPPLETYAPERGEVFYEEEPKPFSLSVREILDEYRSDSSPSRYAMAVELKEDDDWEEFLGPQAEEPGEPIYPEDGRAVQDMLHASWTASGSGAVDRTSVYPNVDTHHLGIDSSPYEEPRSTAANGGYSADESWSWMDILNEYRTDGGPVGRESAVSPAWSAIPRKREREPMTHMEEKPDKDSLNGAMTESVGVEASVPEGEEALPAGIHTLTDRRTESVPTGTGAHLSVEDILAEFHGFAPEAAEEPAGEPEAAAEAAAVPAAREEAPRRRKSRRAGMEEEARRLFTAVGRREDGTPPETSAPSTGVEEATQIFAPVRETAPDADAFEITLPEEARSLPGEEPSEAPAAEDTPAEEKAADGLLSRLRSLGSRRKKQTADAARDEERVRPAAREALDGLDDGRVSPADYAPDDDYEAEEPDAAAFPSFGEYLTGLIAGFWVRLRGLGGSGSAETMETEDEDLGAEVKPAAASRYYGSFVHSLRLRFRIALALWLVLAYISLGLPASGMLRTVEVAAGMCLGLQLGIMLLSLDVVTGTAVNLARGRFGADSLAVLSCILTGIDALAVLLDGFGSPHIPLCLISSFSLLGVLFSSLLSARGLRKSLRVPAIGKRAVSVTAETNLTDRTITLIKSSRPVSGFVRRSEEAAPDETAYNRAAPLLLILAFVMSLAVVLIKKSASEFLFVFTAILAPAVPVTALLCFSLPFFVGSQRIFSSGAAIAGWSGLCDVGGSHNLIVTDRDLFPENCVDIDTIRIFADVPSEKIISYAGTMLSASGAGLASCFAELMERNNCPMRQVENFEFLPGGGLQGTIEGQTVLCGGTELMRLMNVRIPYRLVGKTSVLLAIDGVLYGIFNMKYEPSPTVRKALIGLIRSNRHPIFAIRDFNINPEMLHETFDVATDGYDFPPYVERFAISDAQPSEERKIAAVLCREGLGPLVHMADTGRSMYIAIRINLMISLLASVIGVFAVFLQLLTAGTISMAALFLYAIVWIIPVAIISLIVKF